MAICHLVRSIMSSYSEQTCTIAKGDDVCIMWQNIQGCVPIQQPLNSAHYIIMTENPCILLWHNVQGSIHRFRWTACIKTVQVGCLVGFIHPGCVLVIEVTLLSLWQAVRCFQAWLIYIYIYVRASFTLFWTLIISVDCCKVVALE